MSFLTIRDGLGYFQYQMQGSALRPTVGMFTNVTCENTSLEIDVRKIKEAKAWGCSMHSPRKADPLKLDWNEVEDEIKMWIADPYPANTVEKG